MPSVLLASAFLIFAAAGTTATPPPQVHSMPLAGMNNFVVHYTFEDPSLALPLKLAMIHSLEQLGQVFPGDDTKLSPQAKTSKYQIGQPVLQVTMSMMMEKNSEVLSPKKLPIMIIAAKLIAGVEIVSNKEKMPCAIWEKQEFISTTRSTDELIHAATQSITRVLDQWVSVYRESNSGSTLKPQFFLFL